MAPIRITSTTEELGQRKISYSSHTRNHILQTRAIEFASQPPSPSPSSSSSPPSLPTTSKRPLAHTAGAAWHNAHGPYTLNHLSIWAYFALGVIMLVVGFVGVYTCLRCCRTNVVRVDEGEGEGEAERRGRGREVKWDGSIASSKVNLLTKSPRRRGKLSLAGNPISKPVLVASSSPWSGYGSSNSPILGRNIGLMGVGSSNRAENHHHHIHGRTQPVSNLDLDLFSIPFVRSKEKDLGLWREPKLSPVRGCYYSLRDYSVAGSFSSSAGHPSALPHTTARLYLVPTKGAAAMLPKVATHILHTTSRAAAQAVQAPLRNVLHTGSTNGSNIGNWNGSGSSNWGGHGTGTGSAKQNTGSRYYSSFNAAGRAVSQANAVSANDGSFAQSDENDDHLPRRVVVIQTKSGESSSSKRHRIRSSSVSLTQAESLGVLKTLQLQGRTRFLHTSIEGAPQSQRQSITPATPLAPSTKLDVVFGWPGQASTLPESPVRPRRNSIASVDDLDASAIELTDPALEQIDQVIRSRRNSTSSVEESVQSEQSSVDTKPTTPPTSPLTSEQPAVSSPHVALPSTSTDSRFSYLVEARASNDPHHVAEAVARFRTESRDATVKDFNLALEALSVTREAESAMPMLEVYNDMIKHSVHPNLTTYNLLLTSLTARAAEVTKTLESIITTRRRIQLYGEWYGATLSKVESQREILILELGEVCSSVASLFSVSKATVGALPLDTYAAILRTCRDNKYSDLALEVFRRAEQSFPKLTPQFYEYMIQIYGRGRDMRRAHYYFGRHNDAASQGKLLLPDKSSPDYVKQHIQIWNALIEAYFRCGHPDEAVESLSTMISSSANFKYGDSPLPAASTYTTILKGFCNSGDINSALTWYDRLYKQGVSVEGEYMPTQQPIKPSLEATMTILDILGAQGLVPEMNKLFSTMEITPETEFVPFFVYSANMGVIAKSSDPQGAKEILDHLASQVFPKMEVNNNFDMAYSIALQYLNRGFVDRSYRFFADFFNATAARVGALKPTSPVRVSATVALRNTFFGFVTAFFESTAPRGQITPEAAASILYMACVSGLSFLFPATHKYILHIYGLAKNDSHFPVDKITAVGWQELLRMAVRVESSTPHSSPSSAHIANYAFGGVFSLVEDLAKYQVDVSTFPESLMEQTIQHLVSLYGPHSVVGAFEQFGDSFKQALDSSPTIKTLVFGDAAMEPSPTSPQVKAIQKNRRALYMDAKQTKTIDDILLRQSNNRSQVMAAYDAFKSGLHKHRIPALRTLGRLIQGLGRQGEVQKVHELYEVAQVAYKSLQVTGVNLHDGWVCIEDSMIIALAHAGDIDNAHIHRLRLIDQGAAPSADAYGALILYVKDTTDDAANALMLFREAQAANIQMNIYLFNNIISKLAKARKADYALELFHQMKAQGIQPTSITYGALIGACARVGDITSSEALFKEMVEHKNFRARVPPYNTMMQLYTQTKPNRERALWFYEELCKAGVQCTAHTYKLLLDAYGSIEPVDIPSMEAVFRDLQNDPNVQINGTHYASLINAYGCVQRDLDKAIATFDSVPPASSGGPLDAVVFESIINVFVSHRRTDLIPEYISKMTAAGVHMTAYIANFLIKGYAINGELDKAREIFESLIDPPQGVAAPNNHAPHDPSVATSVGWMEPVYREPSTWEAMVRAELGAGHRDRASELLERLKSRQYPEAVYNRISGVMVDHSAVLA
ncbi:hypothetical protein NP233_g9448 [Leucocoprinus birnbaumii]|uniref:Pentacotripeptide-repeat region of PRORP domain-containing protein n=1 Tax=Leucocoprinus birnbaumii TaxID=56174 RepID=A0AAD5VQW7_9AGAR|nr:hypothetical protein NP233_g9448 [Leucocoprinus birnbaumii]